MTQKVFDENSPNFVLKGRWRATLESGGVIKQVVEGDNVICTNGKEWLASLDYWDKVTANDCY